MSVAESKRGLRVAWQATLAALPPRVRTEQGAAVATRLEPWLKQRPGPVAFFASLPAEIDTTAIDALLCRLGRERALPTIAGDHLVFRRLSPEVALSDLPPGKFRVRAPAADAPVVALHECGAVLVPGMAFDRSGYRLGFGRGFYDRALVGVARDRTCGVLMDIQRSPDRLPIDVYDVPVGWSCSASDLIHHA